MSHLTQAEKDQLDREAQERIDNYQKQRAESIAKSRESVNRKKIAAIIAKHPGPISGEESLYMQANGVVIGNATAKEAWIKEEIQKVDEILESILDKIEDPLMQFPPIPGAKEKLALRLIALLELEKVGNKFKENVMIAAGETSL